MVGVGAVGTLDIAREFANSRRVTFTVLWSESTDAWEHYEMDSTSDFLLLDRFGAPLTQHTRPFHRALVESLLDELL